MRIPRNRSTYLWIALVLGALSLPSLAHAEGGTVTGKVTATPAKYLEETVVYLKQVPGTYAPKTVDMDQKSMTFVPHVLVLTEGDTVRFLNHDTVNHNVFSPDNETYNLGTAKPGEPLNHAFAKAGVYSQLCSIHPEMLGFIFVGQNPYAAVVDKDGHYQISNVPPGDWQLAIWNSHLKAKDQSATVAAGKSVEANFSLQR